MQGVEEQRVEPGLQALISDCQGEACRCSLGLPFYKQSIGDDV